MHGAYDLTLGRSTVHYCEKQAEWTLVAVPYSYETETLFQRNKMELDNITVRKPCKTSSQKSDSDSENSSIFDATIMSLPNASLNCNESTAELNERLGTISSELSSAHKEIENLNSEITALKAELQKSLKLVEAYKQINTTPNRKSMTPLSGRKRKSHKRFSTPIQNQELPSSRGQEKCSTESQSQLSSVANNQSLGECGLSSPTETHYTHAENPTEPEEIFKCNPIKKRIEFKTAENNSTSTSEALASRETSLNQVTRGRRRKIVVIADDQGRHFQHNFQKLVGDDFIVSCYWKPGASMQEILLSEKSEISKLGKEDFLLVLGGMHDKNPIAFQFLIRDFLKNSVNTNVIFSEIPHNIFLNEKKLNYELRFLCSMFSNVSFVNVKFSYVPRHTSFVLFKCQLILKELLRLDYKIKFDNYQRTLNYLRHSPTTFEDKATQTDIVLNSVESANPSDDPSADPPVSQNQFFRL